MCERCLTLTAQWLLYIQLGHQKFYVLPTDGIDMLYTVMLLTESGCFTSGFFNKC